MTHGVEEDSANSMPAVCCARCARLTRARNHKECPKPHSAAKLGGGRVDLRLMALGTSARTPVDAFLHWMQVEAGASPRTLEAYQRDLRGLTGFLKRRGIQDPNAASPEDIRGVGPLVGQARAGRNNPPPAHGRGPIPLQASAGRRAAVERSPSQA